MAAQNKAFAASTATVSTAYAAVLTELEKLKQKGGKRGKQPGGAKGKQKRQKSDGGQTEKTGKCDHYCFAHGYQNSHTSQQCKVMANQPANFTAEQRKATGPHSPAGGSTSVRGRDPKVTAQ
jgi:hypothetical protein